jgi:class 3 adenylate cyclase
MEEDSHHNSYIKKIELFVLFANLFIWIGYAIEIRLYYQLYSPVNMIIHSICIFIFSSTILLLIKYKSRFYKLIYLIVTYTVLINMIVSQLFFQYFFEQTGFGRFHFFSRNVFFAVAFIPVLGIINRKGHILIQGTLILWMITYELISSNDKFLAANASLYYITFISFCWIMYLMGSNIENYIKQISLSNIKINNLLLNILPEEVAAELKIKGEAKPRQYKMVSVLFTDFRAFTKTASTISPLELIQTLNECFSAFDDIVGNYNLEKIKTIGDAYMCAGGIPEENTTNAFDAVAAALEINNWVNNWNIKREASGLPKWEIRIGVHTGELVAGVIGKKKFAYDVWGDAVNLASRMENTGEVGKVNISGTTYEFIKDKFECLYRGQVTAKGKGDVDMYFVQMKK